MVTLRTAGLNGPNMVVCTCVAVLDFPVAAIATKVGHPMRWQAALPVLVKPR
jgi:hypothetical protein